MLTRECDLLNSHEYVGAFKNGYGSLIPHLFLVRVWPVSCFLPTVFIALGSYDKQLLLVVFDKWLREKAVDSEQVLS